MIRNFVRFSRQVAAIVAVGVGATLAQTDSRAAVMFHFDFIDAPGADLGVISIAP